MANGGYNTTEIIPIQYSALVTLVSNSKLVPGQQYRITDYVTTTVQNDTQSANHAFDVIVTADDVNKLNENARAIQHSGDTYFNGQNLNVWQIKYSLTNDTNRFAWADSTNGKGVIYWMKDEYDNECGYDFKNIQMKYYKITATTSTATALVNTYSASRQVGVSNGPFVPSNCTVNSANFEWRYTFDYFSSNTHKDYSLNNYSSNGKYCYNNVINDLYDKYGTIPTTATKKQQFINIISFRNIASSDCYGNYFGNRNCNFSFGSACYSNIFGNDCYSNSISNYCYSNSFGDSCINNTFGASCHSNMLSNNCININFGSSCSSNSFGNACRDISFDDCSFNSFGSSCSSNSFGHNCYFNSFGQVCNYNSFGNNCYYNNFGDGCNSNSFGKSCIENNLSNGASSAIFNDSTNYKSPKFNIVDSDDNYGFISSGDSNTSDTSNPKIYVYGYAMNIGDFDITVQIPYEFSGDITAKAGSSLTGTYALTVPANDSVEFEISAIVSSEEEAESSWEFNAEFDYLLGSTNIHYVGHYEY